jgi:hypothetical protein
LIFYKKCSCPSQVSGRISGIRPLPDIRPDIRYPAFGLAGYPAGRISGKNSIRCIPTKNNLHIEKIEAREVKISVSDPEHSIGFIDPNPGGRKSASTRKRLKPSKLTYKLVSFKRLPKFDKKLNFVNFGNIADINTNADQKTPLNAY